jgi:hypothetical protein
VKEDSSFHLNTAENAVNKPEVQIFMEQGAPTVWAETEGELRCQILDTRSCILILKPGVSRGKLEATNLLPQGVTGEALAVKGQQTLPLGIGGLWFHHNILVSPLPTEAAGLLGTDFLTKFSAVINLERGKLVI